MKKNSTSRLLIVGKLPPPIGGVSIHVTRLLEALSYGSIAFSFFDLSKFNIIGFLKAIRRYEVVHLHSSNPVFRLLTAVICILFGKKLISTIHGDLGRFNFTYNTLDYLAIMFTRYPVTVNSRSQAKALRFNKQSKMISPFIPPYHSESLSDDIKTRIEELRSKTDTMFCTNAYDVSWDKHGNEIYGISEVVSIFKNLSDFGLVCSDPSGNYREYLIRKDIAIPENVVFISEPHSFVEIIKLSDVFLRTTTTDGDSLSVKEAIYFKKLVVASDCVERPGNVLLYQTGNRESLIQAIRLSPSVEFKSEVSNGFIDLEKLYRELLQLA